jgi:hypothetical protein
LCIGIWVMLVKALGYLIFLTIRSQQSFDSR